MGKITEGGRYSSIKIVVIGDNVLDKYVNLKREIKK